MKRNCTPIAVVLGAAAACAADPDLAADPAGTSTGSAYPAGTAAAASSSDGADTTTAAEGSSEGASSDTDGSSETSGRPDTSGCGNVLFLNFDGATMVSGAEDATINSTVLSSFAGDLAPYEGPGRRAITTRIAEVFAAYDLCVFDRRPADGDYTMVVFTTTTPPGFRSLAAIGGPVDCLNALPNGVVFGLAAEAEDAVLANAVAQLVGVSYGLVTVESPQCPSPVPCGDPEIMQMFVDDLISRTFTDLCWNPVTPGCTMANAEFCDDGGQNSHQYLLDVLGPAPR